MLRIHFSASHGLINPPIRWACHWMEGYGHCGFLLDDGRLLDSHVVCGDGVCVRPYDYQPMSRVLVCEFIAPDATIGMIEHEARKLIGTPYDWRWLAGFVFPPLVRGWNDDSRLGCSEFVETACINAGFPLHDYSRVWPQHITPRDIALSDKLRTVYEGPPHWSGRYP